MGFFPFQTFVRCTGLLRLGSFVVIYTIIFEACMKHKLRIAVAAISASAMLAVFLVACGGGAGGPGNVQLAQVTSINLVSANPGVSRAGSVGFALYLSGNWEFLQTMSANVVWDVAGEDEHGNPVDLAPDTALNTQASPTVGHAHRNSDLDVKTHDNRQVFLSVNRYEPSNYLIVTARTNLPGGAANNMEDSVRLSVAEVSGVVSGVTLQSEGLASAHRNSAAGPLTGRFNFTTSWTTPPAATEVPEAERNRAIWSIVSGSSDPGPHGPGATIDVNTGALTIPRGQAPGTLTIRATSAFDNAQSATIPFIVNTPEVQTMTLHGVPAQGNTGTLPRGSSINSIRVDVAGLGYPQDLPRNIRWNINQAGTDAHTQIAVQQNSRYAMLTASFWEHNAFLTLTATDTAVVTSSVSSGEINLLGEPRIGAFVDVAAGDYHILARGWDGSLWAWGRNQFGQLGLGHRNDVSQPTQVEMHTDWIQISGGEAHSFGIRAGGKLYAWGAGHRGALGLGHLSNGQGSSGMFQVQGIPAHNPPTFVRTLYHMLTMPTNSPPDALSPTQIVNPNATWRYVSAGGSHGVAQTFGQASVAVTEDGRVFTWGTNHLGQLARATQQTAAATIFPTPEQATALPQGNWRSINSGRSAALAAISEAGNLYTWGTNLQGEGGRGVTPANTPNVPGRVNHPNPGTTWASVSVGLNFMLAVDSDGIMWSWGSNNNGRLGRPMAGLPTTPQGPFSNTPARVAFPLGEDPRFSRLGVNISQGSAHALAICDDWRMWAWGSNNYGQLGNNTRSQNNAVPFEVMPDTRWRSANVGSNFSMAVALNAESNEDGLIWTWGNNAYGQMGQPSLTAPYYTTPQRNPFNRTN